MPLGGVVMKSACAVITLCLSFAQARGDAGLFFKTNPAPINQTESTMNRLPVTAACPAGRRLAAPTAVQTALVIGANADGAPPGVPVS